MYQNQLKIIIYTLPHFKETQLPLPPPAPTITRLNRLTVLDVVVSSTFKFIEYVEFLLNKVSKTMFALRTLRAHGMADFFTPRCHSSSRMHVIYYNWSATKQRPHPQSVAEISHHSVLSGDRIRQCETSSGSRHKDTYQCL